jgi:phosphoribosyl-ATP pyrophosphohydrolase
MGTVENFSNFVNAVIDEKSFDNISKYIDQVKKDKKAKILVGGNYSKKLGYFIEPTVIEAKDQNDDLFIGEAADLLFHYLILLQAKGFTLSDITKELQKRHKA